jgi:hypothetical protein
MEMTSLRIVPLFWYFCFIIQVLQKMNLSRRNFNLLDASHMTSNFMSSKVLLTSIALRDYEVFNSLLMISDEFKDWLKLYSTISFVNEI